MDNSTYKKLRITGGMKLLTIDAPDTFGAAMSAVAGGVTIGKSLTVFDQVHWFVKTIAELNSKLVTVTSLLKDGQICWVYFPKGSSGIQTDLTRDTGWQQINAIPGIKWLSLVSFDATWSAFAIKLHSGETRAAKTKTQQNTDYIDTVKRIVRLPDDLKIAMEQPPGLTPYFETLSFTDRKEFVLSVVTAKKEETRARRIQVILEQLSKKWNQSRKA